MKEITFYKMVASGNDFVVVDNRRRVISDPPAFAREVCRRHTGIGGDGMLLLEDVGAQFTRLCRTRRRVAPKGVINHAPTHKIDYRVRIINSDGSEAEACGNGFRCISLLTHMKFGFPRKQHFESPAGLIDANVNGKRVRVRLMDPKDYQNRQKIQVGGRELRYDFIRIGVPHVVIFVEGLSKIPVMEWGRAIRFHSRFQPAGTNVNFVEITGPHLIQVETYERGVEQNTLACGTGSIASAIVSAKAGHVKTPVQVKTRGGEVLIVDFTVKGKRIQDVYLEGEAKLVYEGKISV